MAAIYSRFSDEMNPVAHREHLPCIAFQGSTSDGLTLKDYGMEDKQDEMGTDECKNNNVKIQKGELRQGSLVEIKENQSWHYKHWGCVTPAQFSSWQDITGGDPALIDGLDELPEDVQQKVLRAFEQGHVDDEDWKGDLERNRPGMKGYRTPASVKKKKMEQEAAAEDGDSAEESPTKKKSAPRSRKRKTTDDDAEADGDGSQEKTKKSRGRPKKAIKSEDDADEDEAPPPKKVRGRPKKEKEDVAEEDDAKKSKKSTKKKAVKTEDEEDAVEEPKKDAPRKGGKKKAAKAQDVKVEDEDDAVEDAKPASKKSKKAKGEETAVAATDGADDVDVDVKAKKGKAKGKASAAATGTGKGRGRPKKDA
ncbi:MAG: hypothetical protein Q9162_001778 [Coniocarpon cinnabarinum]